MQTVACSQCRHFVITSTLVLLQVMLQLGIIVMVYASLT